MKSRKVSPFKKINKPSVRKIWGFSEDHIRQTWDFHPLFLDFKTTFLPLFSAAFSINDRFLNAKGTIRNFRRWKAEYGNGLGGGNQIFKVKWTLSLSCWPRKNGWNMVEVDLKQICIHRTPVTILSVISCSQQSMDVTNILYFLPLEMQIYVLNHLFSQILWDTCYQIFWHYLTIAIFLEFILYNCHPLDASCPRSVRPQTRLMWLSLA